MTLQRKHNIDIEQPLGQRKEGLPREGDRDAKHKSF